MSDLLSHDFLSMIFGFFEIFWIDIVKNVFKKICFGKYFFDDTFFEKCFSVTQRVYKGIPIESSMGIPL